MNTEQQLALVKKYAPIMWLHEDEEFWPTNCEAIFDAATLWRKGKKQPIKPRPTDFTHPVFRKNTKNLYFKFTDLDMENFTDHPSPEADKITELGPSSVASVANSRYGRAFAKAHGAPMYYARVTPNIMISKIGLPDDCKRFGAYYTVIQYFFYHLFNNSWNMHESDWDGTIEIFLEGRDPDEPKKTYVVYHLHHNRWLCNLQQQEGPLEDIRDWCDKWNNRWKNGLGSVYAIGNHPFVFIALGSHGSYPTPGFSVHGARLPISNDLAADTDERVIGRQCIIPDTGLRGVIEDLLSKSYGSGLHRPTFTPWKKLELVTDQPWVKFKGRWGTEHKRNFGGFDGPKEPIVTERFDQSCGPVTAL